MIVVRWPRDAIRVACRDERGFGITEMVLALTILAIAITAVAGALGLGLRLTGDARQRQAAATVAEDRVEHLRNIPYESVALTAAVSNSPDPDNPDYYVDAGGVNYDITRGGGSLEALVVDATNGQIAHLESDVQSGTALMDVYQYVTWVDDPDLTGTQNYKRISVVVWIPTSTRSDRSMVVTVNAFVTTGDVTVNGTTPGANQGSQAPSPSPTPSAPAPCDGDTEGPEGSFSITSGTGSEVGHTPATAVSLSMSLDDDCTPIVVQFSNDDVTFGGDITYDPANPTASWVLTSGDGLKTVFGRARDAAGNETTLAAQTITLDTTAPTVPGTLTRTVSCSGADRTVNLSWGASTDLNLRGYRIYRSINSAEYEAILTTSYTSVAPADTHKKNLDSVRYYVVAYDRAGNESNQTNVVSLAKNQCT